MPVVRIGCKASRNSFTCRMLFDFILKQTKPDVVKDSVVVRGRQIPLAVNDNVPSSVPRATSRISFESMPKD